MPTPNLTSAAAGETVGMCFLSQPRYLQKKRRKENWRNHRNMKKGKMKNSNWMCTLMTNTVDFCIHGKLISVKQVEFTGERAQSE